MKSQEWPDALRTLHEATNKAWTVYAALEDLTEQSWRHADDRGNIIELTGQAYTLLRNLRAEGIRQLAALELENQQATMAEIAADQLHRDAEVTRMREEHGHWERTPSGGMRFFADDPAIEDEDDEEGNTPEEN